MAKILIADDDTRTRDLLRMVFQGHELIVAQSWPEVIELLEKNKNNPFDLAVTDIVMPGYRDLIREGVRPIMEESGIPTIFISGYSEESMNNLPPHMRFFKKPFSVRMFKAIAEKMLK